MMTRAAMASTIGTALRNKSAFVSLVTPSGRNKDSAPYRGTTHGSWRPRVARTPLLPAYVAVVCS
jgi:hypothetical protein